MKNLPFGRPGRFYKGNLHTHSTNSDGDHAPAEVIERYCDAGYDFLTLSDHFLETYGWPVSDTRALRRDGFTTLIGAELHVSRTLIDELWHVLAIGLPTDFAAPGEGEDIVALTGRAADAGAFLGIVHPQWYGLTAEDACIIDRAHAIEVYNHGTHVENDRGYGWALCDILLNQGRRVTGFATDDAHHVTHDAFGGWIQVQAERLDPDEILETLKAGRYYSSPGPRDSRHPHRGRPYPRRLFPGRGDQRPGHGQPLQIRQGRRHDRRPPAPEALRRQLLPHYRARRRRPPRLVQPGLAERAGLNSDGA